MGESQKIESKSNPNLILQGKASPIFSPSIQHRVPKREDRPQDRGYSDI
jgi:hypothetical protein